MIGTVVLVQHCPSCGSPISEKSYSQKSCEYCHSRFVVKEIVVETAVPAVVPATVVAPATVPAPVVEPVKPKPKKRDSLWDMLAYVSENAYKNIQA